MLSVEDGLIPWFNKDNMESCVQHRPGGRAVASTHIKDWSIRGEAAHHLQDAPVSVAEPEGTAFYCEAPRGRSFRIGNAGSAFGSPDSVSNIFQIGCNVAYINHFRISTKRSDGPRPCRPGPSVFEGQAYARIVGYSKKGSLKGNAGRNDERRLPPPAHPRPSFHNTRAT